MGLPFSESFAAHTRGTFDSEYVNDGAVISYPAGHTCQIEMQYEGADPIGWLTEGITALGSGENLDVAFTFMLTEDQGAASTWWTIFSAQNDTNNAGLWVQVDFVPSGSNYRLRAGNATTWITTAYSWALSSLTSIRLYAALHATTGKLRLEVGGTSGAVENLSIATLPNGSIDQFRIEGHCLKHASTGATVTFDDVVVSNTLYAPFAPDKTYVQRKVYLSSGIPTGEVFT